MHNYINTNSSVFLVLLILNDFQAKLLVSDNQLGGSCLGKSYI